MVRVISENRWRRWCSAKQLPIDDAIFALETCSYGSTMRSRTGTLILTKTALIHQSYTLRDTLWGMFQPSAKITVALDDIIQVRQCKIPFLLRFKQAWPDAHFRVIERGGAIHDFLLHRNRKEFRGALLGVGCQIIDETMQ